MDVESFLSKDYSFANQEVRNRETPSLRAYEREFTNSIQATAIYISEEDNLNKASEALNQLCDYEFYLPLDKTRWVSASIRLSKLLEKLQLEKNSWPTKEDTLLDAGIWSHFVSLTCSDVSDIIPLLPEIRIGADALELRVDLVQDQSYSNIRKQIALLREHCPLPIVFTVRSDGQIGRFPSDDPRRIFDLLEQGLRAGVEWVDVEACWPDNVTNEFCALARSKYARTSRLLGSYHVTIPLSEDEISRYFRACHLGGYAHIVKLVTGAKSLEDCVRVHQVGREFQRSTGVPYIGLCLGEAGQHSRVLNQRFTPVRHPAMTTPAAPGQLTAKELVSLRARAAMAYTEPRQMYLFGSPIKLSLSPAMHNSAFKTLLLPHNYSLLEKPRGSWEEYRSVLKEETFGGASVTIPHKEDIIALLDEVREPANHIGAVNTIVCEYENGQEGEEEGEGEGGKTVARRRLIGLNTDWVGIHRPVLRQLLRRESKRGGRRPGRGRGLVIGAGV